MAKGMVSLDMLVSELYMVGPTYAKRLEKLGIETVNDLVNYFPFRYDDFSLISKVRIIQPEETVTITVEILSIQNIFTKHGKRIQIAKVADDSRESIAVWFNQPFLTRILKKGLLVNLSGKVGFYDRKIALISPEYEILKFNPDDQQKTPIHTGRLVPVYSETYGVSSKWLRSRIYPLLFQMKDKLADYLPAETVKRNNFLSLYDAIAQIHFPANKELAGRARDRLAFDELFLIQLANQIRKNKESKGKTSAVFEVSKYKKNLDTLITKLPFELTNSQRKSITEILGDLNGKKSMNRILEGDVGSGKTVVATIAMYLSFLNGYQSMIMCPTEILAGQHYQTISKLLSAFNIRVALKTQNHKTDTGELERADILVGTHALLSFKSKFNRVGLVVVDEQHRFGVKQRSEIRKKGVNPHFLTMSATPIPRTIALTMFGDLNLSVLDEMPKGRVKVKTWVIPNKKRIDAYRWIENKLKTKNEDVKGKNEQCFIICPLIEESETLKTVKAATKEYEKLKSEVFPNLKIGLVHGRMKGNDKDKVLNRFRAGELDILVATPVIEVGIDIPNATIMLVEGAERFGLSQLHQLRGRVGRRDKQSYCLLFTNDPSETATKRLKAMENTYVGMTLSELDLKLRGPGDLYGIRQHGIPNLKLASFGDLKLIENTLSEATNILASDDKLVLYPLLRKKMEKDIIKAISCD